MSDTILMKVGDASKIAGENLIGGADYAKNLQLLSFSHSVSLAMTSNPSNAKRTKGTARVGEFTFSKNLDATTPKWNWYCLSGEDLGDVVVTLLHNTSTSGTPTPIKMMQYTLCKALIANVSVGGGGMGLPTETITLTFTQIKWDYTAQADSAAQGGVVPSNWDLETNKPIAA